MSQIDKAVFLPTLIWFWIMFCIFHSFVFSNLITYGYFILRIRTYFIDELLDNIFNTFLFLNIFSALVIDTLLKQFVSEIINYLEAVWNDDLMIVVTTKFISNY